MTITRNMVIYGVMLFYTVTAMTMVTVALSSWKARILAWVGVLVSALVFVLTAMSRR